MKRNQVFLTPDGLYMRLSLNEYTAQLIVNALTHWIDVGAYVEEAKDADIQNAKAIRDGIRQGLPFPWKKPQ